MSPVEAATSADPAIQQLVDRAAIVDVLCRYSTSIDEFDCDGVRSTLADDVQAQYANLPAATGDDALVASIREATATAVCQHHMLGLRRIEIDGDHACTVSDLTSHQRATPRRRYWSRATTTSCAGRAADGSSPSAPCSCSGASRASPTATSMSSAAPDPRSTGRVGRAMASIRTVGTMTCWPDDLPEVEKIFQAFIDSVRANEPGVLTYHYFTDDEPLVIHVIEKFAGADLTIQHYGKLPGDQVGRLFEMVQIGPMHFHGDGPDELQALLAPCGSVSYHLPLRSI